MDITKLVERFNTMTPEQIITDDEVKRQFVFVHENIFGEGRGLGFYERESHNFLKWISDNKQDAYRCTRCSFFTTMIDIAVSGLTIERGTQALSYLQVGSVCVGKNERNQKVYEKRVYVIISGYGELEKRISSGQIKYANNPVIVYDNDEFSFEEKDGKKSVSYKCILPHAEGVIKAVFIGIHRSDDTIDYSVMLPEDWKRLEAYSIRNNSYTDQHGQHVTGRANALYNSNNGQIDTGFLIAKCIKKAFRNYPKCRIAGAIMEAEKDYKIEEEPDYYSMDVPQNETFGPAVATEGVKVENEEDDCF